MLAMAVIHVLFEISVQGAPIFGKRAWGATHPHLHAYSWIHHWILRVHINKYTGECGGNYTVWPHDLANHHIVSTAYPR